MKKIWIILSLATMIAHASMFDFMTLNEAEKAYHDSNYTKAIKSYESLKDKNDEARYNLANAYYKAKKYKEAKALYASLKSPALAHQKWHNIGNCEANLGEIDAGIKAYEKALQLKQDDETKYNLALLKKKKKEKEKQKKKQNDKKNQDKKDKKGSKGEQKDKKKSDKQNDKNKKSQQKKEKGDKDKKSNKPKKQDADKEKAKKEKEKQMQQQQEMKKAKEQKDKEKKENAYAMKAFKKEPISDKEVSKYLKMLDKRGVNTLLVPLNTKGAKDEETTPW